MSETGAAACDIVQLCDVKTLDSVNSLKLVGLARAGVTGELVCSCERRGARIYLQAGRVAWASDCRFHRAFTSHLKQHARLDPPAIEAVVAECRATKRPIGEMLVERKLATEEQVRAALRHQIEFALHIGECQGEGRTTFIPHSYGTYDLRFTFEASELLSEEGTVLSELPPRVLAWPHPRRQGCGSPARSADRGAGIPLETAPCFIRRGSVPTSARTDSPFTVSSRSPPDEIIAQLDDSRR